MNCPRRVWGKSTQWVMRSLYVGNIYMIFISEYFLTVYNIVWMHFTSLSQSDFSHPFSSAFYLQAIEFLSLRYSFLTKHVIIFMTTYSIGSGSLKFKVWRWYYLNKSLSSTSNFRVVKTSIDLFLQWITFFFFFKDGCLSILCFSMLMMLSVNLFFLTLNITNVL